MGWLVLACLYGGVREMTNPRDLVRWRELVADDATYRFTDGSFDGIDAIVAAVQLTFEAIQDEVYTISDVQGLVPQPTPPSLATASMGGCRRWREAGRSRAGDQCDGQA